MTQQQFRIDRLELGPLQNFVYVLGDVRSRRAAITDPAWDIPAIMEMARIREWEITDILVTHSHQDHVNGLEELLDQCNATVHLSRQEAHFWNQAPRGQSRLYEDGDEIRVGDTIIRMLHTPGHSPGSACFLVDGHLLTGDTLFVYGCGRCDLPGGDVRQMFHSLSRLQKALPGETVVLPGHHYAAQATSTMQQQVWGNPFLHCEDEDAFVAFRTHHNEHRHPPYEPVPPGSPAW